MQMMAACDYVGTLQTLPPQLATADSQYGAGSQWSVYSLQTANMYDAGHGGLAAQQQGSMLTSSALQQGRQQGRAHTTSCCQAEVWTPKSSEPLGRPNNSRKEGTQVSTQFCQ